MAQTQNAFKKYRLLKSKRDPFYNSLWLSKFSNHFIRDGKKFIIEKAFFQSFSVFKQQGKWQYIFNKDFFIPNRNLRKWKSGQSQLLYKKLFKTFLIQNKLHYCLDLSKDKRNKISQFGSQIIVQRPLYILLRSFIRKRPLFTIVSKRLGRVFKKIPVPLSAYRQLIVALRLCSIIIKISSERGLWQRICSYLVELAHNKRDSREKEKNANIMLLMSIRTNLHFRWK